MDETPLQVQFTLPDAAWTTTQTDPDFVAHRRGLAHDVLPTIRLRVEHPEDGATLVQLSDRLMARAAGEGISVELLHRSEVGGGNAPGVTQALAVTDDATSGGLDVRCSQVLLALLDVEDPTKRVVVLAELACAANHFSEMTREFQAFVASMQFVPGQETEVGRG